MKQRELAITVDYEIFGNGTGDVRQHVTQPTESMARICEKFGMPLTVFFEVEEYLAFVRHRDELKQRLGYDPAQLIREQLVDLARRGHDLQLHLHPEWVGARYRDGGWDLRLEKKTVDDLFDNEAETTDYIRQRRDVIAEILSDAGRPSEVSTYRAGAFCAQPGHRLLPALAANDFVVDSSVVHGLHPVGGPYDYRSAPRGRRHWMVSHDVAVEDPRGPVCEVPIHSVMGRRIFQITFRRMRAKFSKNVPKEQQKRLVGQLGIRKNPLGLLKFLLQPVPIKLDFHNLSPAQLLRWTRNAPAPKAGERDVLILIGHTKEHVDDAAFEKTLSNYASDSTLRVVSMSSIASKFACIPAHGNS
jgi:hypothetical protein